MKAKKLIEVALPIKEISAESVRDKSIRHGHISTLHLWWARRPLPVCRAVVFASLVPDPLDSNCPVSFKDAVKSYFKRNKKNDGKIGEKLKKRKINGKEKEKYEKIIFKYKRSIIEKCKGDYY